MSSRLVFIAALSSIGALVGLILGIIVLTALEPKIFGAAIFLAIVLGSALIGFGIGEELSR